MQLFSLNVGELGVGACPLLGMVNMHTKGLGFKVAVVM